MIRYRCPRCGAKLESPDELAGRQDTCPDCGATCAVPEARAGGGPRWRGPAVFVLSFVGSLAVLGAAGAIWYASGNSEPEEPEPEATPTPAPLPREEALPPYQVAYAWEHSAETTYCVLSGPLTRGDIDRLADELLKRRAELPEKYFVRVYLTEDNWQLDAPKGAPRGPRHFAAMVVGWPEDGKRDIDVCIPSERSIAACYEAYMADHGRYVGSYRQAECDVAHRRLGITGYEVHEATLPRIVHGLTRYFLLGGVYAPWTNIPDLDEVQVEVTGPDGGTLAKVKMTRKARDAAARCWQSVEAEEKISTLYRNPEYLDAIGRVTAKVATHDEAVRPIEEAMSREIYALYERAWVAAARHMQIWFRPGLSRDVPRDLGL